jgi:hypothetical protein
MSYIPFLTVRYLRLTLYLEFLRQTQLKSDQIYLPIYCFLYTRNLWAVPSIPYLSTPLPSIQYRRRQSMKVKKRVYTMHQIHKMPCIQTTDKEKKVPRRKYLSVSSTQAMKYRKESASP